VVMVRALSACGEVYYACAIIPLSVFLFERTAIFTAFAEYIGDLRDKTGEHCLQHDHQRRQTPTRADRPHTHTHTYTTRLPLAVFLLVRAAVLAASAENVHDLRYEASKHRLKTERNSKTSLQWSRRTQQQPA